MVLTTENIIKNAWEGEKDFKENDHAERALPLPERLKFDEEEK